MANLTALLRTTVTLAVLCLTASCEWPAKNSPQEYFESGSIGADLIPLPVFLVLPDMFPENFQPAGKIAGDWIDQFGFVRRKCPDTAPYCLPYGLTVTQHSPQSGSYSMIPYVGMTCALCHTGEIRLPGSKGGVPISGMGNSALDLVAFGDAVRSSALDQRLSVRSIDAAYEKKYGNSVGVVQRVLIRLWLAGFRKDIRSKLPMVGSPFTGTDLRNAEFMPSGPGRILAARDAITRLKNEMRIRMAGPSKLPNLYMQSRRDWAQFDGSVRNPLTRTPSLPWVSARRFATSGIPTSSRRSVNLTSTCVKRTGSAIHRIPPARRSGSRRPRPRSLQITVRHMSRSANCLRKRLDRRSASGTTDSVTEIGTDDARVTPRYYYELASLIYEEYPAGHPLKPKREELAYDSRLRHHAARIRLQPRSLSAQRQRRDTCRTHQSEAAA